MTIEELRNEIKILSEEIYNLENELSLQEEEKFVAYVNNLLDVPVSEWGGKYLRGVKVDVDGDKTYFYFKCASVKLRTEFSMFQIFSAGTVFKFCDNTLSRKHLYVEDTNGDVFINLCTDDTIEEITKEEYDEIKNLYNSFYNIITKNER